MEGSDDGEFQAEQAHGLVEGGGAAAEHAQGELIGEQRDFFAQRDVPGIEEAAGIHVNVAHGGVRIVCADHFDVALPAGDQDAVETGHDAGGGHNIGGQGLADGFHVGHLDVIVAADPARSSSLTVRTTLSSLPYPLSASTTNGMCRAPATLLVTAAVSTRLVRPMSGAPSKLAAIP